MVQTSGFLTTALLSYQPLGFPLWALRGLGMGSGDLLHITMSMIAGNALRTAIINFSASGENTVIAAPTDGFIVIDHINLMPTTANTITFKSGTTALSGPYPLADKQPLTLENAMQNRDGVITCRRNEAFIISAGSAVQIGGFIRYRVVGNS